MKNAITFSLLHLLLVAKIPQRVATNLYCHRGDVGNDDIISPHHAKQQCISHKCFEIEINQREQLNLFWIVYRKFG